MMYFNDCNSIDWYLVNECDYSEERVSEMDNYEKFDRVLSYEGLRGYSDEIIALVKTLGLAK